ncbi:MAG: tetratricopeptide repeat protein [Deltaproteobacteria bacterium]|nr:tetratricopeptide repeat protein [Deltaproteobacteria bacterium]
MPAPDAPNPPGGDDLDQARRLWEAGDLAGAGELARRVAEREPGRAGAWLLAGLVLARAGRHELALPLLAQAARLEPEAAEHRVELAWSLGAAGHPAEAEEHLARAVELDPGLARAWRLLGLVRHRRGDWAGAEAALTRAVTLAPRDPGAWNHLADCRHRQGNRAGTREAFQALLTHDPEHSAARYNLASLAVEADDPPQAVAWLEQLLARRPGDVAGLRLLAVARRRQGLPGAGEAAARQALATAPEDAATWASWGGLLRDLGQWEESREAYAQALARAPQSAAIISQALMNLNYDPRVSEDELAARHRELGARLAQGAPLPPRHGNRPDPERRLRVGYVSADLRRHPVGYFLLPVLTHHDRARFEVICYSGTGAPDDYTARCRGLAAGWREVGAWDDAELARAVAADRVDLLVDLSGHTGGGRLAMFARRPAPVQLAWLGYFHSTGLAALDAVIMDPWTTPPGAERWFVEEVERLPRGRFCYHPPAEAPPVGPLPALPRGGLTLGSFNNVAKLGPAVLELWARVLREVPGTRLVLKWVSLGDPAVAGPLARRLAKLGVGPERLELRGRSPHRAMLAEYGDLDLALDPFPFSGAATTCEALWMGVPVVTLPGERPVSRQTAGFLAQIGLEQFISRNPAEYVDLVRRLAAEPAALAGIRAGMRERLRRSPLMDGPGFTAGLEEVYRRRWRRWCAGQGRG